MYICTPEVKDFTGYKMSLFIPKHNGHDYIFHSLNYRYDSNLSL